MKDWRKTIDFFYQHPLLFSLTGIIGLIKELTGREKVGCQRHLIRAGELLLNKTIQFFFVEHSIFSLLSVQRGVSVGQRHFYTSHSHFFTFIIVSLWEKPCFVFVFLLYVILFKISEYSIWSLPRLVAQQVGFDVNVMKLIRLTIVMVGNRGL